MRKVFSLFLALLMVLAVVPVSVFSVFATEPAAAAADTNWEDMSAAEKTAAYASLYVDGATGIFIAYNAKNDGTITLDGKGGATWVNLAEDTSIVSALTLNGEIYEFKGADGKDYTTGWQFGDKSIGYDLSWQQSGKVHNVNVTSELLGNGDNTMELVVLFDGMKLEEGSLPAVDATAEKWGNIYWKKNYRMRFKHSAKYAEGMTELPATSIYNNYSATGDQGNWNCGSREGVLTEHNDIPVRFYVVEDVLDNGMAKVGWDLYTDAATKVVGNVYDRDHFTDYGETMQLFSQTPMEVYSIRTYKKALNETEQMQNHFVDLCAYLGVDVSKLVAVDDATRATVFTVLAPAFADKSFATASKDAIEAAIDELCPDSEEGEGNSEALEATRKIASLYAPGATGIYVAYNAKNDGSVSIMDGAGAWKNLAPGATATDAILIGSAKSFTGKDGNAYSTGWTVDGKSLSYDVSIEDVKAGLNHYIQLPSTLMGDAYTSTMEFVSARKPLQIDSNSTVAVGTAYSNISSLVNGKNFSMRYEYKITVEEGTTSVQLETIHNDYNSTGRWDGTRAAWPFYGASKYDNSIDRIILMDTPKDAETMQLRIYLYKDGANIKETKQEETTNGGGKGIPYIPTGGAETMEMFKNVPADVYAIRTYDRNLNAEEIMQNHFVDLVFYTGYEIDVDAFAAMTEAAKLAAYTALKEVTLEDATADKVAAAVDAAFALDAKISGVIGFAGLSAKLEGDSNGLRSMYDVNLEKVAALEAEGYVVEIGAIYGVAKYGETVKYSYSDLTLGAVNAKAANMVSQLVYASEDDMGASYVFVEYEAGVDATFAYTIDFADGGVEANETAEKYEAKFVFRGYMKLTKGEEVIVVYTDAPASFEDGASLYDVAKLLVEGDYAENEMLNAIVDKVEQ